MKKKPKTPRLKKQTTKEKKMGKSKKVMIVRWNQDGCGEPDYCYRVDDKKAWASLGQHLLDNAESDGREYLKLDFITQSEWKKIERAGEDGA